MDESGSQSPGGEPPQEQQQRSEHLNIKVTDNNNELFFKVKRTTQLKKLMDAFCERQGRSLSTCRFLFDGIRVNPTDFPKSVSNFVLQAEGCLDLITDLSLYSLTWRTATRSRCIRSRLAASAENRPFPTTTNRTITWLVTFGSECYSDVERLAFYVLCLRNSRIEK